jgi:hypothetical protein
MKEAVELVLKENNSHIFMKVAVVQISAPIIYYCRKTGTGTLL